MDEEEEDEDEDEDEDDEDDRLRFFDLLSFRRFLCRCRFDSLFTFSSRFGVPPGRIE